MNNIKFKQQIYVFVTLLIALEKHPGNFKIFQFWLKVIQTTENFQKLIYFANIFPWLTFLCVETVFPYPRNTEVHNVAWCSQPTPKVFQSLKTFSFRCSKRFSDKSFSREWLRLILFAEKDSGSL